MRHVLTCLALAACSGGSTTPVTDTTGDTGETGTPGTTDTVTSEPGVCVSGNEWTGGDHESPLMHPGLDCVACHAQENDAPTFVIAGTVFTNYHEPDDCDGRSGVTVEITGNDGTVFTALTNAAGNFYLEPFQAQIETPYAVRLLIDGTPTNSMVAHQTVGSCNSCHTENGLNSAPGRIVAGD